MDSVLRDTLTANLKAAKTPEERDNALTLEMIPMIDCQHKTAQRVKALTKAEVETRQKELIERKRLECIEAMRKAQLPDKVLQMLEMRKAAAAQNVTVEAN